MLERWILELTWILLAAVGAVAKYLDDYLRKGLTISFAKLLATVIVGGFTGYMLANVVEQYSPNMAKVAAGMGGFMGTRAMDFILPLIENAMKRKPDDK